MPPKHLPSRKKKAAKPSGKTQLEFPTQVRVRMYRHGFGECFLLTFPRLGKPFHMLIECGVILGTPNAATVMKTVVRDIIAATGGRLDVVVVTHRHWDKLSGFVQAREEFDRIEIGEVWMSWVEDQNNSQAAELRGGRTFLGQTENALSYLRKRGKTRYFRGGDGPVNIEGVPGARVFILGPPGLRPDYATAKSAITGAQESVVSPFDPSYRISTSAAKSEPGFASYFGNGASPEVWRQLESKPRMKVPRMKLGFDAETNNTSLVMAIELTGETGQSKVLLFPGDAQTASWFTWHQHVWPADATPDDPNAITCRKLLERTVLYKASHFGSHSGTPKEFGLDMMTNPDLVAMISVDHVMAMKKRWIMPAIELLEALWQKTRGRVIRSDHDAPAKFATTLTAAEADRFTRSLTSTNLYFDYFVDIPQLTEAERRSTEEKWIAANDRRVYLVDKKLAGTIKPAEAAELKELEQLMDEYMSYVAPSGIGLLTELRSTLDRTRKRGS